MTRNHTGRRLVYLANALTLCLATGCARQEGRWIDLLDPGRAANWERVLPQAGAWISNAGGDQKSHGWVRYNESFMDFVLECEFLFDGKGQGGIVLRGECRSEKPPWECGYELDIGWAEDREHGRIRFPVHPNPHPTETPFEAGRWHVLNVEARQSSIAVSLDGERVIEFADSTFARGCVYLQRHPVWGVQYRSLRVRRVPWWATGAWPHKLKSMSVKPTSSRS